MEKCMYIIKGKSNVGKTETIKLIFKKIKEEYKNADIVPIEDGDDIKFTIKIKDLKIGIESEGDPDGRLKESLEYFVKEECNIILCASRTKGKTVRWIKEYSKGYEQIWIIKNISCDENYSKKFNELQAECVFDKIKSLIQRMGF